MSWLPAERLPHLYDDGLPQEAISFRSDDELALRLRGVLMSRNRVISRALVAVGRVVERRREPVPKAVMHSKRIGGQATAEEPPTA